MEFDHIDFPQGRGDGTIQDQNASNAVPAGQTTTQRSFLTRDLVFGAFIYLTISNAINAGLAIFDYHWIKDELKERQLWLIIFELITVVILFAFAYFMIRWDPDNKLFRWLFDTEDEKKEYKLWKAKRNARKNYRD